MLSFWAWFLIEATKLVVENTRIDLVCLTGDVVCKNGSIISPRMYSKFFFLRKEVISFFKSKEIDIVMVDCSGSIIQLIPIFL